MDRSDCSPDQTGLAVCAAWTSCWVLTPVRGALNSYCRQPSPAFRARRPRRGVDWSVGHSGPLPLSAGFARLQSW